MSVLCRDCLAFGGDRPGPRCEACGSPRIVRHAELDRLLIAHVDCDAFYAAVEKRDDPSLIDKPVIIGGGRRGVVSTACYVARTYGVRSAMPMFKALAVCPDAVVIKPNMDKYVRVAREIRAMMLALTPMVEPLSIDEAFLDLSGTERLHKAAPAVTLAKFARDVAANIGVTVSVGLSHNKFLAKIASDLDKPNGYSVVGSAETLDFLASRRVSVIWGVGAKMQQRLAGDQIVTIADLRRLPEKDLMLRYGREGGRLYRLARGIDSRAVSPEREAKSISAETTLNEDLSRADDLKPILWRLSERVAKRLAKAELAATSVTLKLKTSDFRTRTRARSGFAPTQLAIKLHRLAEDLLEKEATGQRFRLIGLAVHDFASPDDADKGDLVDTDTLREQAAAKAVNRLREKFGDAAVQRGVGLTNGSRKPERA
jgi:DNA polymerase IV